MPHAFCSNYASVKKQNDKYPTNAHVGGGGGGGEYARLELTEPLIKKVILPGKLSILCDV